MTPADLLPLELVLVVAALARPSLKVATATRWLTAVVRLPTSVARMTWIQRMIFHKEETHDQCGDPWHLRAEPAIDDYNWDPREPLPAVGARHLSTSLACYLSGLRWNVQWFPMPVSYDSYLGDKDCRPGWGKGSQRMWSRSQLLDHQLIDHLMLKLAKQRGCNSPAAFLTEQLTLLQRQDWPKSIETLRRAPQAQPRSTWDPLLDLITLAHFFLRTSNYSMLQYTVSKLVGFLPNLPMFSLPPSNWLSLSLDDCDKLGSIMNRLIGCADEVTFAEYLTFVALTQWSVPLVETVLQALGTAFRRPLSTILELVLRSLGYVSRYQRPLCMLRWLQSHGCTFDADEFTSIAMYARNSGHIIDLFFAHDIHLVDVLKEEIAMGWVFADGPALLKQLRSLIVRGESLDVLQLALDHDLLLAPVTDELIANVIVDSFCYANYHGVTGVVSVLAEYFGVGHNSRLMNVLRLAFAAHRFPSNDPISVARFLSLLGHVWVAEPIRHELQACIPEPVWNSDPVKKLRERVSTAVPVQE